MANSTSNKGGVSFLMLLALVFITLKLLGVITWSWWLVTIPLWGGAALVLGIMVIVLLLAMIFGKR